MKVREVQIPARLYDNSSEGGKRDGEEVEDGLPYDRRSQQQKEYIT